MIEGQTVSGLLVRSETWLGARQGLECFGECKPLERLYGGIVVEDFQFQEEKLFIKNLTVAGVIFNLRAEMRFFSEQGASCTPLLCFRGILKHTISLATQIDDLALNTKIVFVGGLIRDFYQHL